MRILFLSGWYPYPADNGSKIRVFNLLRELAPHHLTTLISFAEPGVPIDLEALKPYCHIAAVLQTITFQPTRLKALAGFFNRAPRSLIDTYSPEMALVIPQELDRTPYDAIVASQVTTAAYLPSVRVLPKIFEEVETTVIKEEFTRAAGRYARWRNRLTWAKTKQYTSWLMQQFDACTVVSDLEKENLLEIAPHYTPVEVIPNGVDVDWLQPGIAKPQPNQLVFNGALTFGANFDAMHYFLNEIWAGIKQQAPQATLQITGRTDGVNLRQLPLPDGVTLTGYVPDIRPTVSGAWACVVPLRIGGGTRLKILEAMALGTPVIATTKGAEGLAATPDVNILIADEPAQFVAQTVRLLRDPDLRQRLAANARQFVVEKYSWRSIGGRFNQMLDHVVTTRQAR